MQDRDAAGGMDGRRQGTQHLPVGVGRRDVRQVVGHRLSGHREHIAVQQARVQQRLHHHRNPADAVDVVHHVGAERFHVGQVRHLRPDPGEILERQLDVGLVGDGQQVQHRVGGAAECHHHRNGVLERLFGQDVAGGDAAAQQVDDGHSALAGVPVAPTVGGRWRGAAGQRHAQCLGRTGHGVGGVHTAAGTLTRTDGPLDGVDILAGHQTAGACPNGLERVDDRDVLLGAVAELRPPRQDRSGVQEDAGQIEAGGRHQHAGKRLVAAGQQHRAVEPFGLHDGLDAVGDDLARDQREVHALVAHRDAVGDRDGAELHREAAGFEDPVLDRLGEPVQREVARRDLVPRGRHADLRFGEIVVAHADRTQHAARSGAFEPVGDVAATGLDVWLRTGI